MPLCLQLNLNRHGKTSSWKWNKRGKGMCFIACVLTLAQSIVSTEIKYKIKVKKAAEATTTMMTKTAKSHVHNR